MQATQDEISAILARMHAASATGFAVALHIGYSAPRYLFQSYDRAWLETYSRLGLVMQDPTVRWGFENDGAILWSDLAPLDSAGVLRLAAENGMIFGVTAAVDRGGSRSVASFSRGDRQADAAEMAQLHTDLARLHDLTRETATLSPEVHATLRQMSIFLTHG